MDLKDAVLQRVDLGELIGQYVSLTQAGRELKGRCPFHEEQAASFHVNTEKGLYHCFGCKAGGTAIDFIMRMENLEFRDALEWLARRYNIDIAQYSRGDGSKPGEKERLYQLNEVAAKFFRLSLAKPGGESVRAYLQRRGVSERMIADFDLGYAPKEWQALGDTLMEHGARSADLVKLGLIKERRGDSVAFTGGEEGRHYDTFRHRLIFPIRNVTGRVIGFAGRALSDEDSPKYMNVTNTPLYDKSRVIYNLDRAKGVLRDEGVVVVEGYMDVIGLAAVGVVNAAATCGTALTAGHVKLLTRYTDRFYLAFDGDEAGRRASWSAGVLFLRQGLDARVVDLPEGVDPDDYVREHGADAWAGLLAKAGNVVQFWLEHQKAATPNADLAAQRRWVAQLVPLYKQIPNELVRQRFKQDMASALRLGAAEVGGLLLGDYSGGMPSWLEPGRQRTRADKAHLAQAARQQALQQGALPVEREVMRRLLTDEEFLFNYKALVEPEWFTDTLLFAAYTELLSGVETSNVLHDERFASVFAELLNSEPFSDDNEQLLVRHRNLSIERRVNGLIEEAASAGDREREADLLRQVKELKAQIKQVRGIDASR